MRGPMNEYDHGFDPGLVPLIGNIQKALFMGTIVLFERVNRANKSTQHLHQNRYWMRMTAAGWQEIYHYLLPRSINRWLSEMEADGWISIGNHNPEGRDRGLWYTVSEKWTHYKKSISRHDQWDPKWTPLNEQISGQGLSASNTATYVTYGGNTISREGQALTDKEREEKRREELSPKKEFGQIAKKDNISSVKTELKKDEKEKPPPPHDDLKVYNFEMFWTEYRFKKQKKRALKAWKKITGLEKELIQETLHLYVATTTTSTVTAKGPRWKPMRSLPATYLNDKRFEDEYDPADYMDTTTEIINQVEKGIF